MECFTFSNVTKAICFQTVQNQFTLHQHKLFSIFCLLPTLSFQREQSELHAHMWLLMPWAKSKRVWPCWKFSLPLPLWQTKHCHLLTAKAWTSKDFLFPTPRHNAQDAQQRLLQPDKQKIDVWYPKILFWLGFVHCYLFFSNAVTTLRCQLLVWGLILQSDCQEHSFTTKGPPHITETLSFITAPYVLDLTLQGRAWMLWSK